MSAITEVRLVRSVTPPRATDLRAVAASLRAQDQPPIQDRGSAVHQGAMQPIRVEREADGTYLVTDEEHEVLGVGSTLDEAAGQFQMALVDHVKYLRGNYARLHPRLQASLERLQRQFPWL